MGLLGNLPNNRFGLTGFALFFGCSTVVSSTVTAQNTINSQGIVVTTNTISQTNPTNNQGNSQTNPTNNPTNPAINSTPSTGQPDSPIYSPIYYPGRWQLTEYWIAEERPTTERRSVSIRARSGQVLAWSTTKFFDDLSMEGTGRTWDGRILNWDTRLRGQNYFVEVDRDSYPFGIGVAGYALVPFRSLAVDRRYIPIGHTVEIPDLIGTPLPDGTGHDGCFVAVDGGGAINGHHIDLFVPSEAAYRDLSRRGYLSNYIRSVVVDSPRCSSALRFAVVPVPGDVPLPR